MENVARMTIKETAWTSNSSKEWKIPDTMQWKQWKKKNKTAHKIDITRGKN